MKLNIAIFLMSISIAAPFQVAAMANSCKEFYSLHKNLYSSSLVGRIEISHSAEKGNLSFRMIKAHSKRPSNIKNSHDEILSLMGEKYNSEYFITSKTQDLSHIASLKTDANQFFSEFGHSLLLKNNSLSLKKQSASVRVVYTHEQKNTLEHTVEIQVKTNQLLDNEIRSVKLKMNSEEIRVLRQLEITNSDFDSRVSALAQTLIINNTQESVNSFVSLVKMILPEDSKFLIPTIVKVSNKSHYKLNLSVNPESTISVETDVKVYRALRDLPAEKIIEYLRYVPVYESDKNSRFVELINADQHTNDYFQKTNDRKSHSEIEKLSISRHFEEYLTNDSVDTIRLDDSIAVWLIKGTANLDKIPREKDLIMKGDVQLAFPFISEIGKVYRVILEYRPLNNLNGTKDAILDKIKIVDHLGNQLKSSEELAEFIKEIVSRTEETVSIDISGNLMPFKTRIKEKDLLDYQKFISDFFLDKNRKLENFSDLKDRKDLSWRHFKIKSSNFKNWILERASRGLFSLTFATIGTVATVNLIGDSNGAFSSLGKLHTGEHRTSVEKNRVEFLPQMILKDEMGNEIKLIGVSNSDSGYVFILPESKKRLISNREEISLFNNKGQSIDFVVKTVNGVNFLQLK